jgi:CubicO group peptidase (beta-lactamase class C family)
VVDILPGTKERYSDFNYAIIQQLLIERLGAPFRELMQREVLDPAGMLDSDFEQPLAPQRRANAATGHKLSGEPIPGKYRVHPDLAPSGLWSTPSDICRWSIAVLDAWQGTSERLLSQASARQMLSEGLISVQELDGGDLRFAHTGNNVGFTSVFCAYTRGCGAAVMSNSNNFDIINEVLRAIAIEYGWEEIKPKSVKVVTLDDLSIYAGSYKIDDGIITVSADGDHLVAVTPEGTLTLYPESASDFIIFEQGLPLKFEFSGRGKVIRARNSTGLPIERIELK